MLALLWRGRITPPVRGSDIETLPAKEAGVNGPGAGAKHGQACAECRQQDVRPWIARRSVHHPELIQRDHYSGDGCPQTGEQENSRGCSDQRGHRRAAECKARQDNGGADPQKQKACARRALRKG